MEFVKLEGNPRIRIRIHIKMQRIRNTAHRVEGAYIKDEIMVEVFFHVCIIISFYNKIGLKRMILRKKEKYVWLLAMIKTRK